LPLVARTQTIPANLRHPLNPLVADVNIRAVWAKVFDLPPSPQGET
jgi:hypothetical protein